MANEKTIYGRITCPTCKTAGGVRITKDKNGHPFGFCDAKCGVQIRIGGDDYRVSEFNKSYPEIAAAMRGEPKKDLGSSGVGASVNADINPPPLKKSGLDLSNL